MIHSVPDLSLQQTLPLGSKETGTFIQEIQTCFITSRGKGPGAAVHRAELIGLEGEFPGVTPTHSLLAGPGSGAHSNSGSCRRPELGAAARIPLVFPLSSQSLPRSTVSPTFRGNARGRGARGGQ